MVKEVDVGITEFANTAQPISGILRCRYADFKVEEIDHAMKIAQLTSTDAPKEASAPKQVATFCDESAINACVAAFAKEVLPDEAGNLQAFLQRLQQQVCSAIACTLGARPCVPTPGFRRPRAYTS